MGCFPFSRDKSSSFQLILQLPVSFLSNIMPPNITPLLKMLREILKYMSPITDCKLHLLFKQLILLLVILFLSLANTDASHKPGKDLGIATHTSVNWDNIPAFLKRG